MERVRGRRGGGGVRKGKRRGRGGGKGVGNIGKKKKCLERGSQRCAAVGRGWLKELPAFSLACPPLNPAASGYMPSLLVSTSTPFMVSVLQTDHFSTALKAHRLYPL